MGVPTTCPNCQNDFRDKPIAEEYQAEFGGETHHSRVRGYINSHTQELVFWLCPYCGHRWPPGSYVREGHAAFILCSVFLMDQGNEGKRG